jgi:hypothetical protein
VDVPMEENRVSKCQNKNLALIIEVAMISCAIDEKKRCDVVTADTPGAFMQAEMDATLEK